MRAVPALCLLASSAVLAAEKLPDSLERWKDLGRYFWAMDFSDEARFKADLKAYYSRMYRGTLLTKLTQWVDGGRLESDYYSSHFGDLKDTTVISITGTGKGRYEARTLQDSCYSLEHDAPVMETVVAEYKVRNLTQQQIDSWRTNLKPTEPGEICLSIRRTIRFTLNPADGLIEAEEWSITESTARVSPGQAFRRPPPGYARVASGTAALAVAQRGAGPASGTRAASRVASGGGRCAAC